MTGAPDQNSSPPFPIGVFPIRVLAARQIVRGQRVLGVVDVEITTGGGLVNIKVEFLIGAPAGPSAAIVLRDLRLIDAWCRLVGVADVLPGATRPFPLLMQAIAFKSLGKNIHAEIASDQSPWGLKPRLVAVTLAEAANV